MYKHNRLFYYEVGDVNFDPHFEQFSSRVSPLPFLSWFNSYILTFSFFLLFRYT